MSFYERERVCVIWARVGLSKGTGRTREARSLVDLTVLTDLLQNRRNFPLIFVCRMDVRSIYGK